MFLNNSQNSQGNNTFVGVTFLRTPWFTEHLQWLLLKVSGFQPAILFKKRLRQKCFPVNFAKFLRTSFFWQNTSGWLLLVFICEFWVFQNTSFIEHLRKTAISCTSWRISTTRYSKKLFHRSFQVFYTRTRSSHSKAFIYLKSLKTVCEEVNL